LSTNEHTSCSRVPCLRCHPPGLECCSGSASCSSSVGVVLGVRTISLVLEKVLISVGGAFTSLCCSSTRSNHRLWSFEIPLQLLSLPFHSGFRYMGLLT
jgi:hypothetical protein